MRGAPFPMPVKRQRMRWTAKAGTTLLLCIAAPSAAGAQTAEPPTKDQSGKHEAGPLEQVVTKPLRDTNIIKPKVAPLLEQALKNPYATTDIKTCPQIAGAVRDLDAALGDDFDIPAPPGKEDEQAGLALAAAGVFVGGILPASGLIREVSGANKAQKHAAAAVLAGSVRRGFLKGFGASKGCKPPAAPKARH